jgi:hypothetical protein
MAEITKLSSPQGTLPKGLHRTKRQIGCTFDNIVATAINSELGW